MNKFLMLLNGNKRIIALVMIGLSALISRYPALNPVIGGFTETDIATVLDYIAGPLGIIAVIHALIKNNNAKKTADAEAKTD